MNAGRRGAFTLVELLMVIGIIAILAGLLTPAIMTARRKAQEASTLSLIHECEMAANQFFNDYGDYPPSTWAELDEFFKAPNPDESDTDWEDGLFSNDSGQNGYVPPDTTAGDYPPVNRLNEGIEVFLACLASGEGGGPYLQPDKDMVGNTDGDFDRDNDEHTNETPDILQVTNWTFGGTKAAPRPVLELVDYWGNPLVYFHNRDYDTFTAGATDTMSYATQSYVVWENPNDPNSHRVIRLSAAETRQVYSVNTQPVLNFPPNQEGFQLYSWGLDAEPGRPGTSGPVAERRLWRDDLKNWPEE